MSIISESIISEVHKVWDRLLALSGNWPNIPQTDFHSLAERCELDLRVFNDRMRLLINGYAIDLLEEETFKSLANGEPISGNLLMFPIAQDPMILRINDPKKTQAIAAGQLALLRQSLSKFAAKVSECDLTRLMSQINPTDDEIQKALDRSISTEDFSSYMSMSERFFIDTIQKHRDSGKSEKVSFYLAMILKYDQLVLQCRRPKEELIEACEIVYSLAQTMDLKDSRSELQRRNIPESTRHEVWRRDEGKCVQCGSRDRLEFDHIIPFSLGGSNTSRNLQLLCEGCNRRKSNKI